LVKFTILILLSPKTGQQTIKKQIQRNYHQLKFINNEIGGQSITQLIHYIKTGFSET